VKIRNRSIWLLIIVILYGAWAVTPVSAHAILLRSNPQANAALENPPVQVELLFSEPLESKLSSISVFDANNLVVDVGDVRVDPSEPTRLTVSLRTLSEGVYTVSWKAVSSIDGHQTVGAFPFAVGSANASAVQAIQQSATARLPFSALVSKFILLAALAVLAGQRLFIALVWKPALKEDQNNITEPAVWVSLYHAGLVGVLFAIGLGILSQAGQTTGNELSFPWNPETGRMLTETRLGLIWLARLALAMFAVWLSLGQRASWKSWLGFIVNLALLFTVTLTSHAATEARPFLPILGDLLHLIGMTFWLGGLVHLFTGIRQIQLVDDPLRTKLTSLLTTRFSVNAILFVSLIGLTGFYSAYLRVGDWSALLISIYGHVLLVKQIFVAGLLGIAALNLFIISPRLSRDRAQGIADPALVARFGKILIAELTFAGLLLASVSFLTYLPPARIVAPSSALTGSAKVDDLKMEISISPGRVGQNTFTLKVTSSEGHPLHSAKKVLLRFTSSQANIPPSELELIGAGDGTFSARGAYLSLPGSWQVQAVVRREDKFDAFANYDFMIQMPGSNNRSAASSIRSGGLILAIGLLAALVTIAVKPRPGVRFGLGVPLILLMLSLGVYYLTRPAPVEIPQINPIPANQESVMAGEHVFTVNCAPCHGPGGKGDGPLGLVLNPRPADLTLHAIPGVHTDAQLFEWVTNGFPGSRMPPFKTTLSDTDRWNLVNFIRTLAPK
jgi:copper transport protein